MRSFRWREILLSWFLKLGIPYALLWEGLVVMPFYHAKLSPIVYVHFLMGSYLVAAILVNFRKVVSTDPSQKSSAGIMGEVEGDDELPWCATCGVHQLTRCYHCTICNACIERRDHHCLFTGCCVGRHNHRFFISGVLAVVAGAVYGVVYEWSMVVVAAGGYSPWLPVQLMAPHLVAPFGLLDLWGFVACVHNMLGVAVLCNAGYILHTQLSALRRGQTQYERRHGDTRHDRGWRTNVRDVLGERWLAALLWPAAQSPLPAASSAGHGHAGSGAGDRSGRPELASDAGDRSGRPELASDAGDRSGRPELASDAGDRSGRPELASDAGDRSGRPELASDAGDRSGRPELASDAGDRSGRPELASDAGRNCAVAELSLCGQLTGTKVAGKFKEL